MRCGLLAAALAAIGCSLGFPAASQETKPAEPAVTLVRTVKVGDVRVMKVSATADVYGTEVVLERTLRTEVKEIKDTGEVVTVVRDTGGKVNAGGQELDIPDTGPITVTADKLGRMVKYERPAADMAILGAEVEQLLAIMQDYILSDKAVKPGEEWKNELPNPAFKDKKVQVKTTFVGMDKLDDAPVWKIRQSVVAPLDANEGKMTADLVFLADPANGHPRVIEGAIKGLPTQYGTVDLKLKATQVPAEKSKPAETPK
ncbi:MAG: hypothetical protein GX446_11635 [Chthonomonadales bacterium]|nr:hypothetical protein [Chthonomonadales bacterium]